MDRIDKNVLNVGAFIKVILLVYLTDCSFVSINSSAIISVGSKIILLGWAILLFVNNLILKRKKVHVGILFVTMSIFISASFADAIFSFGYYQFVIAALWIAYFMADEFSLEDFSFYYCILMRIIACVSILGVFFSKIIVKLSFIPTFTSPVGIQYKFLFFTTVPFPEHIAARNFGPFWEPGTYQVYLCIALILVLFVEKNNKKVLDVSLLCIAGVMTLSGAILIPFIIIFATYALCEKNSKALGLVLLVCVTLIVSKNLGLLDSILIKLSGQDSNSSLMFRWIGLEGGVRAFLHNPIFGCTPQINNDIKSALAMKYLGNSYGSNANTFANYFGYFGGFVGCYFMINSFRCWKSIFNNAIYGFLIMIAYLMCTSNENMTASLLVCCIVYFRSCNKKVQNKALN